MAELRKANFRSVNICKLMNQSLKKKKKKKNQGEKLIQTFIFLSCQVAHEVFRRMNVVHIIEPVLH